MRASARDHLAVADGEADPPARHVVALRQREELDADVLRARHLQEARRLVAVEDEVGVGEVVHDQQLVLARELDDALEEGEVDDLGGRVVREVEDQQLRLRPASAAPPRAGARGSPRPGCSGIERRSPPAMITEYWWIGYVGLGHEDDVAGAEHGERQVPDAFLRADRDDRLARRDRARRRSAACTSRRSRPAACRCRATPSSGGSAAWRRLDQLLHDVRRRRRRRGSPCRGR